MSRQEKLSIDPSSVHINTVVVREWSDSSGDVLPEVIAQGIVANAVSKTGKEVTVVQFEQIASDHWEGSLAFRPGMGWRNNKDKAIRDICVVPDETAQQGIRIEPSKQGRWLPVETVGRIIEDQARM